MRTRRLFLKVMCETEAGCKTCRDLKGGRFWRESAAAHYEMPEGGTDFPCPKGKAWGYEPPPKASFDESSFPPLKEGSYAQDSKGNDPCSC